MATTTPNFGWSVPTSSDLVKNGATAIETLGDSIDASMVDLKGGTTGQVLAKATGTDMDFTWTTPSSGGTSQAAGRNYLINGAMDFWQRNTSSASLGYQTVDRWYVNNGGGTTTSSRETSIIPSVARYALKLTQSVSSAQVVAQQPLESQLAIPLAGQSIIVSAYVAASASTNFTIDLGQSTSTDVAAAGTWSFTSGTSQNVASTTYVRVSQTFTVSGTSKSLMPRISMTSLGSGNSFYVSGVQMEIGSVASTFTRATGTVATELAACQRYYSKTYNQSEAAGTAPASAGFNGMNTSSTNVVGIPVFKVSMRVPPTATLYSAVTGTTGKIRSGGADISASVGDVGENGIGYISATGLTSGSNSVIVYTVDAEL
jgi:hypothetical protein